MPRRADPEAAEDHEREPAEREQGDDPADQAHPAQPPPRRVLEDAPRGRARC
jgi:hypothetical protein